MYLGVSQTFAVVLYRVCRTYIIAEFFFLYMRSKELHGVDDSNSIHYSMFTIFLSTFKIFSNISIRSYILTHMPR